MRIGIVGLGYMGRARLAALRAIQARGIPAEVVGAVDPKVRSSAGLRLLADVTALLALRPDWVIIAAPHGVAAESCRLALAAGTQVLLEKPLGRDLTEAKELLDSQVREGQLWVGLNYRFFEGIHRLLTDVRRGAFGSLVSANLVIGHGHQPGMERNWKLDPREAGNGVLIDSGIHLLDVARLLAGEDIVPLCGVSYRGFWRTGVEEECHLLLRSATLPILSVQASIVRWRSTFRIEVHGHDGYGIVEGRGRSYGPQTYRTGHRWGWRGGRPQRETEVLVCRTDGADVFERELRALLMPEGEQIGAASAESALLTVALVDACRRVVHEVGER